MRVFKLVTVTTAITLTLVAVTAATASALPEFLTAKGAKFTDKSGKVTIAQKGGGTISCTKSKSSGEVTGANTATDTFDFEGCTSGGLATNSLGDAASVILIVTDALLCYITSAPKDVGLLFTILPTTGVHIEVPAAKLLLILKDRFVALIRPINVKATMFELLLEEAAGVQKIEKCEGNTEGPEHLLWSHDGGAFVEAGIEAKEAVITFEAENEIKA